MGSNQSNERKNGDKPFPVLVLFADIVGSVTFAETLSTNEYHKLLSQFHRITKESMSHYKLNKKSLDYLKQSNVDKITLEKLDALLNQTFRDENTFKGALKKIIGNHENIGDIIDAAYFQKKGDIVEIRGDELIVIKKCDTSDTAIEAGVGTAEMWEVCERAKELKLNWFTCDFNKERIEIFKQPIDIAIGISFGYVSESALNMGPEGYSISLAKRIEGAVRNYAKYTRILLSRKAYQIAVKADLKVLWTTPQSAPLRGIYDDELLYEIRCFYDWVYWEEIEKENIDKYRKFFNYDYSNSWLGITVATVLFQSGQFYEALEILERILWVNKDVVLAWVLMSECVSQIAVKEFVEKTKAKSFGEGTFLLCNNLFERAIHMIDNAIKMDSYNEDLFVERGIIYHNWSVFLKDHETKNFGGNGETERECALASFIHGNIVGINKTRSSFWLWLIRYIMKGEKKIDIVSLGKEVGWIKSKGDENDFKNNLHNRIEKYLNLHCLPIYQANLCQCVAFLMERQFFDDRFDLYQDGEKKSGIELSILFLNYGIEIAKNLKERNNEARIYFNRNTELSIMVPVEIFIKECRSKISKLEKKIETE